MKAQLLNQDYLTFNSLYDNITSKIYSTSNFYYYTCNVMGHVKITKQQVTLTLVADMNKDKNDAIDVKFT